MSKYKCSQETAAVALRNANLISIAACGRNIQEHRATTKTSVSLLLSPKELEVLPSPSGLSLPACLHFSPGEVTLMLAPHTQATLCEHGDENNFPPDGH